MVSGICGLRSLFCLDHRSYTMKDCSKLSRLLLLDDIRYTWNIDILIAREPHVHVHALSMVPGQCLCSSSRYEYTSRMVLILAGFMFPASMSSNLKLRTIRLFQCLQVGISTIRNVHSFQSILLPWQCVNLNTHVTRWMILNLNRINWKL